MLITANLHHIQGIFREQYMEWFQSLKVNNTYQVPSRKWLEKPHSLEMMEAMLNELDGEVNTGYFKLDVFEQYNNGRRAGA